MARFRPRRLRSGYPAWIEVAGFKSIRDPARIELRPLTLLAGANSSGKSSILQPVLLLKQSLQIAYDPDPLLLNGPHVAFSSLDQFLSRGKAKASEVNGFEVAFGPFRAQSPAPSVPPTIEMKMAFSRSTEERERLKMRTSLRNSGASKWFVLDQQQPHSLLEWVGEESSDVNVAIDVDGLYTYVRIWPMNEEHSNDNLKSIWRQSLHLQRRLTEPLDWARHILHLPGHRGHRDRRYPMAKVTGDSAGSFSVVGPMHPYTASLLLEWQRMSKSTSSVPHAKKEAKRNLKQVSQALKSLGLTWKAEATAVDAADLEISVGRMPLSARGGAQDLVSIADVGFGLSQVLPVLVALAAAVPGQLVLVEQPELHLHPRAQLAMGKVLTDAAKRGIIVVVETHSQLVLRAIQTIVARGELTPDQVGLHWFSRDEKSGWSTVTRADLAKDGSFGDWPVDFPDVYAMADEEFIDAVFGKGEVRVDVERPSRATCRCA